MPAGPVDAKKLAPTSGGAAWRGERSYLQGAYHICSRCGSRVHISNMQWQRGLLLCKKWDCVDRHPLIGEREAQIAHALEVPTDELRPDPKLVTPSSGDDDSGDLIMF